MTSGGTDGNQWLTTITGLILIGLLAVLGVTILRIHQLIWLHLFIGLLLIGPVMLKMASTGYRFVRFYTWDPVYRRKGPPELWLRLMAPILVLTTVVVFGTGVVLLFGGSPGGGTMTLLHKVSFFAWLVVAALHVLGHLPATAAMMRSVSRVDQDLPGLESGRAGRRIALAGALVGGLVLAVILIPEFAAWSQHGAFLNHG